ncbi:MAG: endolytic transglycosylase MltG [Rickettsiaceae bacterium]
MLSKYFRIKIIAIIISAALSITSINLLVCYLILSGNLQEKKTIIIEPNLSIHQISELLEQNQIIKHGRFFELCSMLYSFYSPLKSGEYEFTTAISPYQVIKKLAKGRSIVRRLVIPEGYSVKEIIDKLNAEERLNGVINRNIPEGYLMPSTYFYSYGDQRNKILDEMLLGMSKALDQVMLKLSNHSPLKNRKDVLILASIVEKEAGNDQERKMIAAVFVNRLKKGMRLQADPTVIYAITRGKGKLGRLLTRQDLQIESEYNTYKIKGLPLGPISCPGLASLEAVVSPSQTKAMYFVANGQGGHNFANSLAAHNQNVRTFKKEQLVKP